MPKLIRFLISHLLFWLIFFLVFRLAFLISITPLPATASAFEILLSLLSGYRLDLSIASYLFSIPLLSTLFHSYVTEKTVLFVLRWINRFIIFLFALICLANIVIFKYWGTLLNNRALAYLAQPREAMASATNLQLLGYVVIIAALVIIFTKLYERHVLKNLIHASLPFALRLIAFIILLPMAVVGVRGGIQLIPVNESSAIYSAHQVLNQTAINPVWSLGHNLSQSGLSEENPYIFMDEQLAENETAKYLSKNPDDTLSVFRTFNKPNVVILLLESWTADVIEPLGGEKGVTPNFSELSRSGLLFSSVYSSGFRTDQALVSALSGFPSQPNKSIIRYPAKAAQLPSLANEFKKKGYTTTFYYGGETGFANMNSYLVNSGYSKIINIDDFASQTMNSKWGAHDEFVLDKQLQNLSSSKQPFFSTLLTLSTHEPFEVPVQTPFNGKAEEEQFKKSAWYTDYCLGNYFKKARQQPWYPNTIFILLADHGHRLPMNRDYYDPRVRQIPVLIVSELLKEEYVGKTIGGPANQHDLPATILRNMGMDDSAFEWSVNMTDPSRLGYAYLSLDVAVTFITDKHTTVIPLQPGFNPQNQEAAQEQVAKAYLQRLYQTFISY